MSHGGANKDGQQDSSPPEKNLHGLEEPSKFFLTLPSLCQSKKDQFKNNVYDRLALDTEVLHSPSQNQNQVQKKKGSN